MQSAFLYILHILTNYFSCRRYFCTEIWLFSVQSKRNSIHKNKCKTIHKNKCKTIKTIDTFYWILTSFSRIWIFFFNWEMNVAFFFNWNFWLKGVLAVYSCSLISLKFSDLDLYHIKTYIQITIWLKLTINNKRARL